jgi:hypothetical protein
VGVSFAETLQERLDPFHTLPLGEDPDPFNPAVNSYHGQVRTFFRLQTGDPARPELAMWRGLDILRRQQASASACFDCFRVFALIVLTLLPIVLLMKHSAVEKGTKSARVWA